MDSEHTRSELTFIVRVSQDEAGQLSGIVERVRTGEKQRFYGPATIGQIIERTVAAESEEQ